MQRRGGAASLLLIALLAVGCATDVPPSQSPQAEVATATLQAAPSIQPAPSGPPTPTPVATMAPPPPELATVTPVEGTDLPIAARDGAPGLVSCAGTRPTTLEALMAVPTGAEEREGDEYDVLRETVALYGHPEDAEFASLGDTTYREYRPDATTVVFLGTHGEPEGPFSQVTAAFVNGRWTWAGMDGACLLEGEPGSGWGWANWTLDPDHDTLTRKTRTLHLLATEYECHSAPLRGRLAPAWVFLEPGRVRLQLFAKVAGAVTDCEGTKPTKIRVRLPEPLGRRELMDANPGPCPACGG